MIWGESRFGREWGARLRRLSEAQGRDPTGATPSLATYGYAGETTQVFGGFTQVQRLMTLTGACVGFSWPTSSALTLVARTVTPVDKALPKRLVDAAVRCAPARTQRLGDGSSSGVAATVAKGRPNGRMTESRGP